MEVWPGSLERINLVEPSQSMQRAGQSLFKGMVHRVLGLFNCICIFLKIAVLLNFNIYGGTCATEIKGNMQAMSNTTTMSGGRGSGFREWRERV